MKIKNNKNDSYFLRYEFLNQCIKKVSKRKSLNSEQNQKKTQSLRIDGVLITMKNNSQFF